MILNIYILYTNQGTRIISWVLNDHPHHHISHRTSTPKILASTLLHGDGN